MDCLKIATCYPRTHTRLTHAIHTHTGRHTYRRADRDRHDISLDSTNRIRHIFLSSCRYLATLDPHGRRQLVHADRRSREVHLLYWRFRRGVFRLHHHRHRQRRPRTDDARRERHTDERSRQLSVGSLSSCSCFVYLRWCLDGSMNLYEHGKCRGRAQRIVGPKIDVLPVSILRPFERKTRCNNSPSIARTFLPFNKVLERMSSGYRCQVEFGVAIVISKNEARSPVPCELPTRATVSPHYISPRRFISASHRNASRAFPTRSAAHTHGRFSQYVFCCFSHHYTSRGGAHHFSLFFLPCS